MKCVRLMAIFAYSLSFHQGHAKSFDACIKGAKTQLALNQCAGSDFKKADNELNRVYKKIRNVYKKDVLFLQKLKKAQRAWVKLRDADFDLKYPHAHERRYYGSSFPMCGATYRATLTIQRVRFLKQWLEGIDEGDVCSGSVRRKEH